MQRRGARRTARGCNEWLLLPVLVACALLIGSAAWAQDDADTQDDDDGAEQVYRALTTQESYLELGFLWNYVVGEPSAFAQYRGLGDHDKIYVLGNLDIYRRAPWDGDSTQYWRVRGLNLGLDSRSIDAEYGQQGRFGVSFLYDQLPVYKTWSAQSFFLGKGTSNLTLPPGWIAGGRADIPIPGAPGYPTAFQTSIDDNLQETHIGWQRRKFGGGFSVVLPADLEFKSHYSYETKKGTKLVGSTFGTNGGNPRSVLLPEEIDYTIQTIDSSLTYNGDHLQLELAYFGSAFNNDENSQTWTNPYTAVSSWDPSAGFQGPPDGVIPECIGVPQCGIGQRTQPPDSWFNQILASGGYDLPYRTRVTLQTAFSWATQDDKFLPFTINPLLTATTPGGVPTNGADPAALPRSSLDGQIFTTVVDFGIASRPIERLRLDTGYRFERRDNQTPRDLYIYIPNDSADQGTVDGGTARINMPYSLTRHTVNFDAGYELPRRTEVSLGYEWELVERNLQEVANLYSNTLGASVISRPFRMLNGRVNYEHTWREGSDYNGSKPFVKTSTPEHIQEELDGFADPASDCFMLGLTPEQCLFENHPLLRKYYQANLQRDKVGALFTLAPREDLTISPSLNWWDNDYEDTTIGLTSVEHLSPGLDVQFMVTESLSTYVYYNYEWRLSKSKGWEYSNIGQALDPTRIWKSNEEVHTHTVGTGFTVDVIRDRLLFGADYVFANSKGAIDTTRVPGSTLPTPEPFPDLLSRQHNVSIHAEYKFTDNLSMRVGYLFQYLKTHDWALDGLTPTSLTCSGNACVIGAGQESPHYTANVVSWSLVYRFW